MILAWSMPQGELGMGGRDALRQDLPAPAQGMVAGAERSGAGET